MAHLLLEEKSKMLNLQRYKNSVMRKSRQRKVDQFYKECKEECRVLDVGVSMESVDANPARNSFLKSFRFPKQLYAGMGIQDLSEMPSFYPGFKFYTYDGNIFPFNNDEFDMVWSNAVIEHVGNSTQQLSFLNEMLRVSKKIFFTTPNKYFPVETHTNMLFLHFFDRLFGYYLKKHTNYTPETLTLLSHDNLSELLRKSNVQIYRIIKNRYYGITMTFSVVAVR